MSELEILISEEKGVRQLHFGSEWVQGAMRVARPWSLELEYTRAMLLPLTLAQMLDRPFKVLCIGLGVGALPKFLYRYFPDATIQIVEIFESVHAVAQAHFAFPALEPRLQLHIACGATFLSESSPDQTWDLILVDGFDEDARAGVLDTHHFYQQAFDHLSPQGWMSVNLLCHELSPVPSIERLEFCTQGQAMGLSPCKSGNVIALAHKDPDWTFDLQHAKAEALRIKTVSGLNLLPFIELMPQAGLTGQV